MRFLLFYVLFGSFFFISCSQDNQNSLSFIDVKTFTKQIHVDRFNYDGKIGKLIIKGPGIKNLKGLGSLTSVFYEIEIEGTNIESLEGLENIIEGNSDEHFWPQLRINSNHKLKDVSAIQNFVNECVYISILNNTTLSNLGNLTIPEKSNLVLGALPLFDFKSIVFPRELRSLEIWRMPNISDLSGLEKLENLYDGGSPFHKNAIFNWNPNLKSLKGLENFDGVITATNNESLSDYCALKKPKTSSLHNNLFNPTSQEFDNGNCKQ